MKKVINYIFPIFLAVPGFASAAPLISDPTGGPLISPDDVFNLVNNIKNIALSFAGVIVFAMIIYGGVQYITSGGNDEKLQKAKQILTSAIVGLIIVICSYAALTFIANSLGGGIS